MPSLRACFLDRGRLAAALGPALLACSCASRALDPGPSQPTVEYLTRQEILTPLPLRVRLPAASGVEHVVVLYRTWGSSTWSRMELARAGQTWTGEISCREVSTVTGDTRYFFVVLDAAGKAIGGSGSEEEPLVATVSERLPDGPQSLPGGWLTMRCHDPADCPPDFPGCPAYAVRRTVCRRDDDCGDDQHCAWDGYCGARSAEVTREARRAEGLE